MDAMVEEHIGQVLEVMPDPVILMRAEGTIAFANSHAAKLLGYVRDDLIGLPLEMLVPERFREQHVEHSTVYLARPVVRPMGGRRPGPFGPL